MENEARVPAIPDHEIIIAGQTVKDFYQTEAFVPVEGGNDEGVKVKKQFGVIELLNGVFIAFELNNFTQIGIPTVDQSTPLVN